MNAFINLLSPSVQNFFKSPFNSWVMLGGVTALLVWVGNVVLATNGFSDTALVHAVVYGALLGIGMARVLVIPKRPIPISTRILHGTYQAIWFGSYLGLILGPQSLVVYAIQSIVGGCIFGAMMALMLKPSQKHEAYLQDITILDKGGINRVVAMIWPFATIGLALWMLLVVQNSDLAILTTSLMLCFAPLYRAPAETALEKNAWFISRLPRFLVIAALLNVLHYI